MRRGDLEADGDEESGKFDGWQAVDGTPQEESEGELWSFWKGMVKATNLKILPMSLYNSYT